MPKKKTKEKYHFKKLLRIFIPFLVLVIYLWTSYVYIYYKIGSTALPATDTTYSFDINPLQSENNLMYAALGDSLTAGVGVDTYTQSYPYVLAQKIAVSYDNLTLKDFSYPGAKTSNIIDDLLTPVITSQPDVVTILIGINDIHGRVSPETFNNNYRYILERLEKETTAKIYLISIPYLGSHSLLLPPFNYYFHFRVDQYNKIIKSLAHTYNLNYIDITSPTAQISQLNSYYAADLFHPNANIYALWAHIMYDNLGQ
jgi:lysophospholipase L1-like esterase